MRETEKLAAEVNNLIDTVYGMVVCVIVGVIALMLLSIPVGIITWLF